MKLQDEANMKAQRDFFHRRDINTRGIQHTQPAIVTRKKTRGNRISLVAEHGRPGSALLQLQPKTERKTMGFA